MESATFNAFKNANNIDKEHFSSWFIGIWGRYNDSSEIDCQVTVESLKKLRDDLNSVMLEYKQKNKNIAAKHTENFFIMSDASYPSEMIPLYFLSLTKLISMILS